MASPITKTITVPLALDTEGMVPPIIPPEDGSEVLQYDGEATP